MRAVTKTIQRLYDRSELLSQIRYTTPEGENQLLQLNKQIGSMFTFK